MLNPELPTAPADVLILPMTDDLSAAISLATQLREVGIRAQIHGEQKKFKQKTAYEIHSGDWSSDVCSSDLKGMYVITVSSKQKPVIVDNFRNEITDPGEVYSGCYGRASINFYGYSSNGKKGISAGLLSIQKLHDGEPFGTVGSASDFDDDWTDTEADDDDFMA